MKGLEKAGITANAIHGNKSQNHRERTLAAFRTGEIRTLVATDIAARGIDVDGISHVVNFDLPNVPETYVHRIGRTARAGADGVAISLIAGGEEMGYLRDIERLIRISLPREDRRTPGNRDAAAAAPAPHRGGRPLRGPITFVRMTRHRIQKGLADDAAEVVIMGRRRRTGASRHDRLRPATARACKASPFCIAKAGRNRNPTATTEHSTSRRSTWRTTWLKKS